MTKVVLSFFDFTGEAVRPWAEAGYECWCFDIQHEGIREEGNITFVKWDATDANRNKFIVDLFSAGEVAMVFGFPPCTDLASSGARHWASKRAKDPAFQTKAVDMALTVAWIAKSLGAPYAIENPTGALCTLWRQPDWRFNPCDYGGYLPEQDRHPRWPEYIPARDAYTKRTCLWTGNGFNMPRFQPVEPVVMEFTKADGTVTKGSPQWAKLGGKSLKTKNIRSATPRGFARAVFLANS